jgi:hypothetical protein
MDILMFYMGVFSIIFLIMVAISEIVDFFMW